MKQPEITIRLKGGLGNQMFQYAAARALALNNDARLFLDMTSGFARDRVFRRTYALNAFPVTGHRAGTSKQVPFWLEQVGRKLGLNPNRIITDRMWGTFLHETRQSYLPEIGRYEAKRDSWVEGYFQSARYFERVVGMIADELRPPAPADQGFLTLASKIEAEHSVAVGVRLFEEVPQNDRASVGGVVPFSYYEKAAAMIAQKVSRPVFYVFTTQKREVEMRLKLPGETYLVTPDCGFQGAMQNLWLISQCRDHIISNSSFYWWGAWLAGVRHREGAVFACDLFPNPDTIPPGWARIGIDEYRGSGC